MGDSLAGSPAAPSSIKGRVPGGLIERTLPDRKKKGADATVWSAYYSASVMTGESADMVLQGGNGFSP